MINNLLKIISDDKKLVDNEQLTLAGFIFTINCDA